MPRIWTHYVPSAVHAPYPGGAPLTEGVVMMLSPNKRTLKLASVARAEMSEWCRRCARVVDGATCPACGKALGTGSERVVRGTVRTLRGFIRARDGSHDSILFTAADIESGPLSVGDIVECVVDKSPYGPVARKIRRIQAKTRETKHEETDGTL